MSRTCPSCHTHYEEEILHCPEDGLDLSAMEPDDELIGRTVGSYQIVKLLGKGGMGAVYQAEHPVIGSRVAIKFLHPQFASDRKIVDRFFNEARAVNVIGHDNILKILDLNVTEDQRHYFIMEFLGGKPLQDLIIPDAPMSLLAAGPILLQICEALQAAHDHKIIHRDLKPDNVYLIVHKGRKNFVKVVDFGIAKLTDESGQSTGKTQTGMVMGTPAYMSPEQAGGMTGKIDGRSDIYSLGCMMFQMATGHLPFPGTSFGEVLIGHLQLPPPVPRSLAPGIPQACEKVILKCLAKKPEERYQSMREVHDEIARVMDELGISRELPPASAAEIAASSGGARTRSSPGTVRTPRPPTPRPSAARKTPANAGHAQGTVPLQQSAWRPPRRWRSGLFIGIGIAALAVVGGGTVFMVQQQAEETRREAAAAARLAARRATEAIEERRRADEEAARKAESEKVSLSVVSEPIGAIVEVTWKDGAKASVTPLDLSVPRNAKVHLSFRHKDYLPASQDVIADATQVVRATLAPDPRAASLVPRANRARSDSRPGAQKPPPSSKDDGDPIPVEF